MPAVVKTATVCTNSSDATVHVVEEIDHKQLDLVNGEIMCESLQLESTNAGSFSEMQTHESQDALQTNISSEDFCNFHRRLSEIQDSPLRRKTVLTTVTEQLRSFGATIRSFGATRQPDSDEDDESSAVEKPRENKKASKAHASKKHTKVSVAQSRRGCAGKKWRMFRCFDNLLEPEA